MYASINIGMYLGVFGHMGICVCAGEFEVICAHALKIMSVLLS